MLNEPFSLILRPNTQKLGGGMFPMRFAIKRKQQTQNLPNKKRDKY